MNIERDLRVSVTFTSEEEETIDKAIELLEKIWRQLDFNEVWCAKYRVDGIGTVELDDNDLWECLNVLKGISGILDMQNYIDFHRME